MHLHTWTREHRDVDRIRRLWLGTSCGVASMGALLLAGFHVHSASAAVELEETIDVKVAKLPELEVPKEPAAALPSTDPPPAAPQAAPIKPRLALKAPSSIPEALPSEGVPSAGEKGSEDPYGDGATPTGAGTGVNSSGGPSAASPVAAVEAKPSVPPKRAPQSLPENATPPVAVSAAQPAYPDEARRTGVEATIVVKFVVTEAGNVADVAIVRGHPLFDSVVLQAVRNWRYTPALYEGRPISVSRVLRIHFGCAANQTVGVKVCNSICRTYGQQWVS